MKKKFHIVTLGCRTNQYESQAYTDQLKQMGYIAAKENENAELCIVNTCTVTASADTSSRHKIRSLIRSNPKAKVVVTGCMVESAKGAIQEINPEILIVPNAEKEDLLKHVFLDEENLPEFNIKTFDAHTRAFIKVQDGCNSFCTYCTIPYVRGRSRSRKMDEILKEARGLVENGYREIVLTGINIGDFEDGKKRLADLVREVDQIEGLERIRISSIDPDEVDENLADAVLNSKKTCPSMHIVLQSGSNVILKKMNRKYTKQMFFKSVEKLVRANPDFTFTTDIIVGFPGESEEDFAETVDAVKQVRFAKVHMFPYSPRKRTRAALYPNPIASEIIQERKERLLRFAEKTAFDLREQYIGRTMSVLLENSDEEGWISGHTENFLRVKLLQKDLRPNQIVRVNLLENHPDGLYGNTDSD